MFNRLEKINQRPKPFEFYTAEELWSSEHTAKKILEYHLNETVDLSSRNKSFIKKSVKWIISYFDINKNVEIADFGCGTGLYTTPLAEKGAKVTGIDFSKNSLDGFWSSDKYYSFLNTFKYEKEKVTCDLQ